MRDAGAVGDGAHDDTEAFARALDALPAKGGTLFVPEGVYLINPARSIVLRDGITLELHPRAVLKAIPVVNALSYVVCAVGARNIRIAGGSIIGEREGHLGESGEWGMGILLLGCDGVVIEDLYIADCWGDGICITPREVNTGSESRNVVIRRCRAVNNRRQGLSITGCIGATVEDCEFSGTNGIAPSSGILLEPDTTEDVVRDVRIRRCRCVRNAGHGLMLVGPTVTDVVAEKNVLTQNGETGLFVRASGSFVVRDNTIELNGMDGVWFQLAVHHAQVTGNVIGWNGCAFPKARDNVFVDGGSSHNVIDDNDFTDAIPSLVNVSRFDIHVADADCVGNRLRHNRVRARRAGLGGIVDNGSQTEIAHAIPLPKVKRHVGSGRSTSRIGYKPPTSGGRRGR